MRKKEPQVKTLYVTDLDGTLLNSHDFINPFSIETINSLVEKGMLFTYATARSLVSASVVAKGLSTQIPVIAYNGAFIFHPATGEILASEGFRQEEREKSFILPVLGRSRNFSLFMKSFPGMKDTIVLFSRSCIDRSTFVRLCPKRPPRPMQS